MPDKKWRDTWYRKGTVRNSLLPDCHSTSDAAFYERRTTDRSAMPSGTVTTKTSGSYASRWLRHYLNGTT